MKKAILGLLCIVPQLSTLAMDIENEDIAKINSLITSWSISYKYETECNKCANKIITDSPFDTEIQNFLINHQDHNSTKTKYFKFLDVFCGICEKSKYFKFPTYESASSKQKAELLYWGYVEPFRQEHLRQHYSQEHQAQFDKLYALYNQPSIQDQPGKMGPGIDEYE